MTVAGPSSPACLRPVESGCELLVQAVPNAARTAVAGVHDGALRVRLAAPAIEGRANRALIGWLADELGLPRRSVRLVGGETARSKRLRIDADVERVAAWVASALGEVDGARAATAVRPPAGRGR